MNDTEKHYASICKRILGLPNHVCNTIVLSNLRRTPLLALVETQILFQRLLSLKENAILYIAFKEEMQQDNYQICRLPETESEIHFLFHSPNYNHLREPFLKVG